MISPRQANDLLALAAMPPAAVHVSDVFRYAEAFGWRPVHLRARNAY